MNRTLSIFLLVLYSSSLLRPVLPYLDYLINYEYISSVLCINKNKPTSSCNGKCYLNEKLSQVADRQIPKDEATSPIDLEKHPIVNSTPFTYLFNLQGLNRKSLFGKHRLLITHLSIKPPTPPPKYF